MAYFRADLGAKYISLPLFFICSNYNFFTAFSANSFMTFSRFLDFLLLYPKNALVTKFLIIYEVTFV
jgi:hypothetical protein